MYGCKLSKIKKCMTKKFTFYHEMRGSSSSLRTSVIVRLYCFPVGLIVLVVGLYCFQVGFIVLFVDNIVCNRMGYCL